MSDERGRLYRTYRAGHGQDHRLPRGLRERRERPARPLHGDGRAAPPRGGEPAARLARRALRRRRARRLLLHPCRRRAPGRPQEGARRPADPSGNSMLAMVLLRLARIYGDEELEHRAVDVFRLGYRFIDARPERGRVDALRARAPLRAADARSRSSARRATRRREALRRAALERFAPNTVFAFAEGPRRPGSRAHPAARRQGPRRRSAGRLRLRGLRLPGADHRSRRASGRAGGGFGADPHPALMDPRRRKDVLGQWGRARADPADAARGRALQEEIEGARPRAGPPRSAGATSARRSTPTSPRSAARSPT